MAALSGEEVTAALEDLPGWRFEDGEISKRFRFASFMDAIWFIDRVAVEAEAMDHHPDLENHYDRVRVRLHTWTEQGVTAKDLELARRIEAVAGEHVGT
jgi:4a-hydroxytetrahydrobiopterin dehydratase